MPPEYTVHFNMNASLTVEANGIEEARRLVKVLVGRPLRLGGSDRELVGEGSVCSVVGVEAAPSHPPIVREYRVEVTRRVIVFERTVVPVRAASPSLAMTIAKAVVDDVADWFEVDGAYTIDSSSYDFADPVLVDD